MTRVIAGIEIQTGVPIPEQPHGPQRGIAKHNWKMLLGSMRPGESFVVRSTRQTNSVRTCAYNIAVKLAIRKQPDGTYRVWRV